MAGNISLLPTIAVASMKPRWPLELTILYLLLTIVRASGRMMTLLSRLSESMFI